MNRYDGRRISRWENHQGSCIRGGGEFKNNFFMFKICSSFDSIDLKLYILVSMHDMTTKLAMKISLNTLLVYYYKELNMSWFINISLVFDSVFWDLYCAAPERRDTCEHSSEAKAFHDYVSFCHFVFNAFFYKEYTFILFYA